MLTPRHQALLAALSGMTVGVIVFGGVLVLTHDGGGGTANGATNSPAVSTPSPTSSPNVLRADRLQYTRQTFGPDRDVTADIPATWIHQPQDNYENRYVVDRAGTWMIRVNPKQTKQSPRELAEDRHGSVRAVEDFQLVGLVDGTSPTAWNTDGLTFTTLIFTSTRREAGQAQPRMQLSRWVSVDGGRRSALEITVAGRPEDEAGLQGLLDRATSTLVLGTKR